MLLGGPPFHSDNVEETFELIIEAPLDIPAGSMSDAAAALVRAVLNRDPELRLETAAKLRAQPWFADVDFPRLLRKEVRPPFVPAVAGDDDTSNVDPAFLRERPSLSDAFDEVEEEMADYEEDVFGAYCFDEDYAG